MMKCGYYTLPFRPSEDIVRRPAPTHQRIPILRHCIDWAMPEGTPILAARAGIILDRESRYSRAYSDIETGFRRGNIVVLGHADGQSTRYGHLAWRSVCVKLGQHVRRGHVIGYSGQTGYAEYPHLHFGAYFPVRTSIRVRWYPNDCSIPEALRIRRSA